VPLITPWLHIAFWRLHGIQGQLTKSYDLYQKAAQFIHEAGGRHLGAISVLEVGIADVLCEWNDLEAALSHVTQGMASIPLWSKADDIALAYITLSQIRQPKGTRLLKAPLKGSNDPYMRCFLRST
jgi:hypothetical protein